MSNNSSPDRYPSGRVRYSDISQDYITTDATVNASEPPGWLGQFTANTTLPQYALINIPYVGQVAAPIIPEQSVAALLLQSIEQLALRIKQLEAELEVARNSYVERLEPATTSRPMRLIRA